ncbi:MAG: MBL fold metallo-hydrolase [Legionellales bacterium]|nr:MBL fold metallo-hydrolase [Legionellales bacterium]
MLHFTSVLGNSQRLDGGAMFGNAPKAVWQQWMEVDELNRVTLTCRALLIRDQGKTILLETGIGNFFDPKLKERYGVIEADHILLTQLAHHNISHEDIDFIILSHLHFDHAGGLLTAWQADQEPQLLFPNAQFLVGKTAWERACDPHVRDRASFLPHLNRLLSESQRLVIIEGESCELLGNNYRFHISHGHTPGMLLTEINTAEGPLVFAADLIPGTPWVHLPITMGYDRYPELLINEKKILLEYLVKHNGRLFYTHDPKTAMSQVCINEQQKFSACHEVAEIDGVI